MKSRKTLAVILSLVVVLLSIPLQASAIEKEHIFTYEELACMEYVPAEECKFDVADTLMPINNIENSTKGTTAYYIIECSDGYMLTNPSGTTFSRTRYNSGSLQYKKWNFTEDSNGDYIVYSYSNPTQCLTVNPTSKTVSLSTYSSSSNYQKWRMYYSSNGNALKCVSSDSSVNGYKLVISGSSLSVSSSTYTPVGFFDVSWYVPATGLSYSSFYLAPEQSKYVYPNKTPSNAICSNSWINWSSSNTSCMTVNSGGRVTGVSAGSATLTFRDRITRVYGTCTVNVTQISNGTYFLKNKQNSKYARVEDDNLTNGQNVVQYSLENDTTERWIFTLNTSTGYYSIKSASSGSTAYYMAVSDDSSAINKPIVVRSATESTLTDGMKWKVSTTSSGAYKITPKTGEANDYVLCTKTIFGFNNWNLVQSDYVQNNTYCDEWELYKTTLTYWYSDSDTALYWQSNPIVYTKKIDTSSSFYFQEGISSAVSQWTGALNISFSSGSESSANFLCYGATKAYFSTYMDVILDSNTVGLTKSTYYPENTTYWGDQLKTTGRYSIARIYIASVGNNLSTQKEIVVHEYGHALGYLGHSSTSSDVMYPTCHSSFTLKDADKKHLQQFYN